MIKFLPVVALILVVSAVLTYFNFFNPPKISDQSFSQTSSPSPKADEEKKESSSPAGSSLEDRISTLEAKIDDILERIKKLEEKPATVVKTVTQTPIPVKKPPLYIPFGGGATAVTQDWSTSDAVEVTIDPADYNGYSSMQLEASIKVLSGNGKAFARIFNNNEKLAILSSEVSTTSENYTWITSDGFKLPSGKKTYRFQLKTLSGYEASVKDSKLRVNF